MSARPESSRRGSLRPLAALVPAAVLVPAMLRIGELSDRTGLARPVLAGAMLAALVALAALALVGVFRNRNSPGTDPI